jgi:cell division protein FtsW (lipid II flippase)
MIKITTPMMTLGTWPSIRCHQNRNSYSVACLLLSTLLIAKTSLGTALLIASSGAALLFAGLSWRFMLAIGLHWPR